MIITANILDRTFFIKSNKYGTAFTVDIDGLEYLVTARHLLDDLDRPTLRMQLRKEWPVIPVSVVGHGRNDTDISVLRLPKRLSHRKLVVELSTEAMALGQDVYFAGFPLKMYQEVGDMRRGWPMPFVKRGILSAFNDSGRDEMFVDAYNNEGFSGGPLVFERAGHKRGDPLRIAGVVVRYKVEPEMVVHGKTGESTGHTIDVNTGFLIAHNIRHVLNIVAASSVKGQP